MANKWMFTLALLGIVVVVTCGMLLPIAIGFKVSMIAVGIIMIIIFSIIIPFDRKYIVRKNGFKIDFTKQKCIFAGMYLIQFPSVLRCMLVYVFRCSIY